MRRRASLGAICGAALLFAACDAGGGGGVDAATVSPDAAQPADGSVGDAGPSGSDGAADADALGGPVEGEPCEGKGSRICTLDGQVLQCRDEGGDRLWAPFDPNDGTECSCGLDSAGHPPGCAVPGFVGLDRAGRPRKAPTLRARRQHR